MKRGPVPSVQASPQSTPDEAEMLLHQGYPVAVVHTITLHHILESSVRRLFVGLQSPAPEWEEEVAKKEDTGCCEASP